MTSAPQPSTATVSPPIASAPLCAAESIPRAMPLTIVSPAWARSLESRSATAKPYGVGRRVPTTASEIVTTAATRELSRLVMLDAAHLQEEEARRRAHGSVYHGKHAHLVAPLYSILDAFTDRKST